ncbi:methyltransferase domain-containing protein [Aureococcus anophagefferens]|nr:methyltransferase domain-containing protein [Aureococcus anophagefferens]
MGFKRGKIESMGFKRGKIESMGFKRAALAGVLCALLPSTHALVVGGVEIPHAKVSPNSRALDSVEYPEAWPFSAEDLRPMDPSDDQLFYLIPKFVHHGGECRECLTKYYGAILPPPGAGAVLDLCSSWTSHYPKGYKAKRCAALGLNALELLANPSKTEWKVQNLNTDPKLPYETGSFDVVTNSLSADYLTSPLGVFEVRRVLAGRPRAMAFTNRCFPTKVARVDATLHGARSRADPRVLLPLRGLRRRRHRRRRREPRRLVGQRDPMVVVQARKQA